MRAFSTLLKCWAGVGLNRALQELQLTCRLGQLALRPPVPMQLRTRDAARISTPSRSHWRGRPWEPRMAPASVPTDHT